ncbi:MAG: glycosyltransferase family 1 protein [Gemmatimonadaceae bacterium]|nr:glycosyltransferase family 1 protein [Gloeobacterales cyanobacterium ES-bin-141]
MLSDAQRFDLEDKPSAVYFYCVEPGLPTNTAYQHETVCLAEGLTRLGIRCYSNIDYWLDAVSGNYLLKHDQAVRPEDCSVVILSHNWFDFQPLARLPERLFAPDRKYITAYIDNADGLVTRSHKSEFRQFDHIFRAHSTLLANQPKNMHPWAFGLSERILRHTIEQPKPLDRQRKLLVNFRVSHPVRAQARTNFLPRLSPILPSDESIDALESPPAPFTPDYIDWMQTGRRHYPGYYHRLRSMLACACFGGFFFEPSLQSLPHGITHRLYRLLNKIKPNLKFRGVIQWDSWRLWEAFAAGCTVFHLDFEKYGMQLPIMPHNWEHYIGVDMEDPQATVDRLVSQPELLEQIGLQGQQWAYNHYSPIPTARRFIKALNSSGPTPTS